MLKKIFVLCLLTSALNALHSPEDVIKTLTLRQKIAQLFIVAAASNLNQPNEQLSRSFAACPYKMDTEYIEHLITTYGIGGVIFLYKSDPKTQRALTKEFQKIANIPLLIAQDCEWGLSMRLDIDPTKVVRYPRNMTLGAIEDGQILYDIAKEIGKQCRAIGVHMNFAPVVDVNNNKRNPVIHDRSFGDNPERVAQYATLFSRGLHDAGILACAKHFPGHGDTYIDSHVDLPTIKHDRTRLNAVELIPFKALIEYGVDAIMHAHLHIPVLDATGTPSSLSYNIVTALLQEELNFQGLNITDGLGMGALTKNYAPGELELNAFLAGNDILLCPLDVPLAINLIEQSITTGLVTEEELDRRVLKILHAKKWALEQCKKRKPIKNIEHYLTRPKAYHLQQKAYSAALTLIPRQQYFSLNKDILKESCILQIGELPNNIFAQGCEQHGSKVLKSSHALTQEEADFCISATKEAATIIIAIGQMNKNANDNFGITRSAVYLIEELRRLKKDMLILLFGTPYSVELFQNDTIIVAYEDAPAAQRAVIDALYGKLKPTGILPVLCKND